jgi:hypothetical protein
VTIFDLAAVDAALGVDFVGGHLGRLRDRGAGDRLRFRDDADLDGVGGKLGLAGMRTSIRRQQAVDDRHRAGPARRGALDLDRKARHGETGRRQSSRLCSFSMWQ